MEIIKCLEYDGMFKIELRTQQEKIIIYLESTDKKITGMYKGILDNDFIDVSEQDIVAWKY
jgi:hypothetical protein|tara:strand:- start:538 stop:720 length:183 start_codon:yes stop_codon:yes gene_type:complete